MSEPVTWVAGAGGLLGGAVLAELGRRGLPAYRAGVPWESPEASLEALVASAASLASAGPWRLVWAAGAGVVATSQEVLDAEVDVFRRFLDALSARSIAPEALFLASSAGGVYAGSGQAPYDEQTPPRPLAPYGHAKLAMEAAVHEFVARAGSRATIGRIANLYGPGQDLSKPQGLISQMCRAELQHKPLSIWVPLDTARDYLYVDDAARLTVAMLGRAATLPAGEVVTKIMTSGRAITIASLLGELRNITKRRSTVVLGSSPSARFQIVDLRFRTRVWTDLDTLVTTGLPAGVNATYQDIARTLRVAG